MCQSECRQLLLSVRFIRENRSMLAALQKKDWKAFARLYNGPAYAQNRFFGQLSTAYYYLSEQ
ncbi:MAG: N-acetylmuramidase family protein [Prevotella sp.]|nr:N-acetylmuramidase family protein [Prevotella sp.]